MASKSLGPFPKTRRWRDIVGEAASDVTLTAARARLDAWTKDEDALRAVVAWVGPVIAGRFAMTAEPPVDPSHPAVRALAAVRDHVETETLTGTLFPTESSKAWKHFDGPCFCDLARLYFEHLLAECLLDVCAGIRVSEPEIRRFAKEASVITRSFSARWFNACARYEAPEIGTVRWYLGHCLGKLDLELCREESGWAEPTGNPWKRRRQPEPQLQLD